jgi:hypothetical protein
MEARGLGKLLRQLSFIYRLKLYRLWFFRMWEDRVLVLVPLMLILQQALSVRNVPTPNQNIIICFVSVVHLFVGSVRYRYVRIAIRHESGIGNSSPTFGYVYKRPLNLVIQHMFKICVQFLFPL